MPRTRTLKVVETYDGRAYLGSLVTDGDTVKIMTNRVGHPVLLDVSDIAAITPAEAHPDVEVTV